MYFNVFQVVWLTPLLLLWVLMYSALKLPVVSSFRYNQEANYLVNLTCYSSNTLKMQCWSCAAPSCWWRRSSSARCAACVSVQTWEAEGFCPLLVTRSHFNLFQRPPLPPLCIFFTQLLHKMSQKTTCLIIAKILWALTLTTENTLFYFCALVSIGTDIDCYSLTQYHKASQE